MLYIYKYIWAIEKLICKICKICTYVVQCVHSRFEMKIVGYLLHNGNGNGLGDWGQNLRKPKTTQHTICLARQDFGQNWNIFLPKFKHISWTNRCNISVQPNKFFSANFKIYFCQNALWVVNQYISENLKFCNRSQDLKGNAKSFLTVQIWNQLWNWFSSSPVNISRKQTPQIERVFVKFYSLQHLSSGIYL